MKRFVSVTACFVHNNYQSHPRLLVKGFVKMTENNNVIKEDVRLCLKRSLRPPAKMGH